MDTNIVFSKYAHNQIIYKEGDLIGKCIFLKEIQRTHKDKRRALFRCICGNEFESNIVLARTGDRVGCGCSQSRIILKGEANPAYKHGLAVDNFANISRSDYYKKVGRKKDPDNYKIWAGIKRRCFNMYSEDYPEYGGRGITMYSNWVGDFKAFNEYVGPRPSPQHSLDRFPDKNGNYEPGNVRWATPKEQARNTRKNKMVTYNGEARCLSEWSEIVGIKQSIIGRRLNRGWLIEDALTLPPGTFLKNVEYRRYEIKGESVYNINNPINIHPDTIRSRIKRGWPMEEVLGPLRKK